MEEIKKSLYESYKWLYEEAIANMKKCLTLAKERRELGRMGWEAQTSSINWQKAISVP